MDIFDCAQEADAEFRRRAVERQRRVGRVTGVSLMECIDCGEPIPEKRRLACPGCERCIGCQAAKERLPVMGE